MLNQAIQKEIEDRLNKFFQEIEIPESSKGIYKNLQEFVLRPGKRIRPYLVMTGFRLFSNADPAPVLDIAAAVELMHSYFLIHDDIMDGDDKRRGKPTFHRLYKDNQEGLNAAILAGDLLQAEAYRLIVDSDFPEPVRVKLLKKFNEVIILTGHGQWLDLNLGIDASPQDVMDLHMMKTARYTFEGPLHLGAVCAGAGRLWRLSHIALPLGLAFQLRDDILGLYGTSTGKPAGTDLRQGRMNLLVIKTLRKAQDSEFLKKNFGKNFQAKTLNRIRKIVKDSGSLAYSEGLISTYTGDALTKIDKLEADQEAKDNLKALAEHLADRKK
ncbi:MAG: polyprenyl synthetase family protein [Nanoarchaeota archaeon]|nr:polyprenyl synthetase family protein [Nanoarchaeota archaeon]